MLTFRSGGSAILVYAATLVLTLANITYDDKLSLHSVNATLLEAMEDDELSHNVATW